jgi:prepilin-type N-terminal cleavage/methylation domain-containing protein
MIRNRGTQEVHRKDCGFTLPELMVGMGVFALVAGAIASVSVTTLSSAGYQARISDAQLDVASGMALVQDDLRAIGYVLDDWQLTGQLVVQQLTSGTSADSITFVADVDSDDVSERITYAVSSASPCPGASSPCLLRTQDAWSSANQQWSAGSPQVVAGHITAFTLVFSIIDPYTAVISQQTATQLLAKQQTNFVTVTLSGTGTYKGTTVSRTLTSDVAVRQENVEPKLS